MQPGYSQTPRPGTPSRSHFSDAIAAVRRVLWLPPDLSISRKPGETVKIPITLLNRVFQTLCLAA
jgi:hypothetical protein